MYTFTVNADGSISHGDNNGIIYNTAKTTEVEIIKIAPIIAFPSLSNNPITAPSTFAFVVSSRKQWNHLQQKETSGSSRPRRSK